MIILEKPYVSSLLKQTVISKKIPVLKNEVLDNIALNGEFNAFQTDQLVEKFKSEAAPLIYSNSENSIEWINKHLSFTSLPDTINRLKDKHRFRELLQPLYPNFHFRKIRLEDIDKVELTHFPFIIKPAVGFLSLGIYKVDSQAEWKKVKEELKTEISKIKNIFPSEVMNLSEFLIEDIIEGDEFAIDVYYKKDGKPVILNIYKHLFSSSKDVSDRSYHTSKEIIEKYMEHFTGVMGQIGRLVNLKNFPMHIEMRLTKENDLIPIEANPLRFAGWCMTDMAYYAYNINPYEYYFEQKEPNWNELLKSKDDKIYYVTIAEVDKSIDLNNIESINYEAFLNNFSQPLELRKTDYKKYPVFAFMFSETNKENFKEVENMLKADLKKFINLKN